MVVLASVGDAAQGTELLYFILLLKQFLILNNKLSGST